MNTFFTTPRNNALKTAAVALVAGAALLATPRKAEAQAVIGFRAGHARVGVGFGYAPAYPAYAAPVYAPPVYGYGYAAPSYGYYGGGPYYRRDWDHDRDRGYGYDRRHDFDRDRHGWR